MSTLGKLYPCEDVCVLSLGRGEEEAEGVTGHQPSPARSPLLRLSRAPALSGTSGVLFSGGGGGTDQRGSSPWKRVQLREVSPEPGRRVRVGVGGGVYLLGLHRGG